MHRFYEFFYALSGQIPVADEVDKVSHSLERGGLYTVCAILLGFVVYLFWAKEKEREKFHSEFQALQKSFQEKLLQVVEEQTKILTKQALLTEAVERLLTRVTLRLEQRATKEE